MIEFGRSRTPRQQSANAMIWIGTGSLDGRSVTAKVSAIARSQMTANRRARHITPTKTKAGGNSARSGGSAPSAAERPASVKPRKHKHRQKAAAGNREM